MVVSPLCIDFVWLQALPSWMYEAKDGWYIAGCRCVTTLQSNMLRQLVAASLQDYLEFFRQHAAVKPLDPQQNVELWSCPPVFEVELAVHDGEQTARPSKYC